MRRFIAWFALAVAGYGAFAAVHHGSFANSPRKVLVGIDTSSQMDGSARDLRLALERIGGERYALFSVVVDKGRRIHSWEAAPRLDQTPVFYGDRQLEVFADASSLAEMQEADEFVLVSNAQEVAAVQRAYPAFRQVVP